MKWETIKLSDCCVSIADGDHQPPPKSEQGVPFVTIANINSYNEFDFSDTMFVPQEYYDRLDGKRKAQIGDVLYSVVGSFGIPVLIKDTTPFVFQRHIAILRPDTSLVLPEFLYYTMLSRDFYSKADAVALGAAQRTISLTSLRNIIIDIPSIDYQKRIVSILSSYDRQISNIQKQIKLLEEAAQRLYKEWFIDLRFPSHETTPIINGIPEGWKQDRADSFFNISIGKTPPRAESRWFVNCSKEGIPWISISDMGKSGSYIFETTERLTTEAIEKHNVKIIPADTVLVSFKLTVGRVSITTGNMCTNEAIAHFRVDKSLRNYTYLYLKSFEYDNLGNTSAISKAVNSKIIKGMPFVMPDNSTLVQFEKLVSPIMDEIYNRSLQIKQLTEARDRLLPKLMSGEIEV